MKKLKNIKKQAITAILGASLLMLGLTGCGSETESAAKTSDTAVISEESNAETEISTGDKAEGEELKVVRIGAAGQDDNVMMEVATLAYRKGYFEEELNPLGYTVEFKGFLQTGPEVNEAIASGSLDGAIYGDLPAFVSNSNGIESTIIATVNSNYQYGILTANADIKEAKDLEGKKVIVPQGTVVQRFWEQYAAGNGIDTSKVEVINTADAASLLQTGEADAVVSVLYSAYYYAAMGLGNVIDDGSNIENSGNTLVVTLANSFLEENPDVAVAINIALIRAAEDAQNNPESYYEIAATDTLPADVIKTQYAFDESLSYLSPEITDEILAYYDSLNNWLFDNNLIAEKVDLNKIVDTSYYEQAVSELAE